MLKNTLRSIALGVIVGSIVMLFYTHIRDRWLYYQDRKQTLSCGVNDPMRLDSELGTLPAGKVETITGKGMKIMILGDPFLWGGNCPHQESLPYLTAKKLDATLTGSSLSAYNLAQFMLRAKQAIERDKPDFVVIQYSSWLIDRSMKPRLGYLVQDYQVPYFYQTPERGIAIAEAGNTHQISHLLTHRVDVIRHAYGSLAKLGYENGAKVFFLLVGLLDANDISELSNIMPSSLVTTDEILAERIKHTKNQDSFLKEYEQWKLYPKILPEPIFPKQVHSLVYYEVVDSILKVKEGIQSAQF